MKWIFLRIYGEDDAYTEKAFADDVIPGLLSGEFWMMASSGEIAPVETLIDTMWWPKVAEDKLPKVISFIRGHNAELALKIQYYAS
jgi:hypothetical protein